MQSHLQVPARFPQNKLLCDVITGVAVQAVPVNLHQNPENKAN